MSNTCIWIDATRAGAFEVFQFNAIQSAARGIADVYLATNLSPETIHPTHINIDNSEVFSQKNNFKQVNTIIPGNPDLKILALLNRPEMHKYSNFIRIEFDCVFAEDIQETIRKLVHIAEVFDVGFSSSFPKAHHSENWPWWKTFENWRDAASVPPSDKIYGAFLPVLTFNRKFIESYTKYLRDGWRGHYEVLVPTVAHWDSLTSIDFGKNKEFHIDSRVFTVHRPQVFDSKTSKFFHPVKSFDDFRRLPTRTLRNYKQYNTNDSVEYMKYYANENLSAGEFDLVKRRLRTSDSALVYGSLGIAEVACSFGIQNVDFISSDRRALSELLTNGHLRENIELGNLRVQYINIGKTSTWGNPTFPEEPSKWERYVNSIPGKKYDTIVLSGRFRVSLSANIYMKYVDQTRPDVIITNFRARECYQDILQLFNVAEEAGNVVRLSFREARSEQARAIFQQFSQDYR